MGQDQVRIFDTTLRDGEQAPGFSLRPSEKLPLARQLDALGVDIIEAGFPIASPADAEAVRTIATEIRRPVIACLARCHKADLERAAWALEPAEQGRIHTFIATSDLHLQAKLRMTREQCLEAAVESVRFARRHTSDVEFSAEDATRSDFDFLCRVIEAVIDAGATTVNLPDTVGYTTPDEIRDFFTRIRTRVPNAGDSRVQHALPRRPRAGRGQFASRRCSGARVRSSARSTASASGRATPRSKRSSWRSAPARTACRSRPTSTSRRLYPSSELLTKLSGQAVQVNKAVVGRNAFAHEAGIHQDGVLKDRRTYEIMRAEDVGAPWNPLVLGKHSGRHAVQKRCADLGFALEGEALIDVYRALMAVADDRKTISDDDIREAVAAVRDGRAPVPVTH